MSRFGFRAPWGAAAAALLAASCATHKPDRYHYNLTPPPPLEPLPDSTREPAVYKAEDGGKICRVHIYRRVPFVVVLDPAKEPGTGPKQRYAYPDEQERILARMKADVSARTLEDRLEHDRALREEEIARRKVITPELIFRMEGAIRLFEEEQRDRERELRADELSGYKDPDEPFIRRRLGELQRQVAVYRIRLALMLLRAQREGTPVPPA